jgi:hypothetical protein
MKGGEVRQLQTFMKDQSRFNAAVSKKVFIGISCDSSFRYFAVSDRLLKNYLQLLHTSALCAETEQSLMRDCLLAHRPD